MFIASPVQVIVGRGMAQKTGVSNRQLAVGGIFGWKSTDCDHSLKKCDHKMIA